MDNGCKEIPGFEPTGALKAINDYLESGHVGDLPSKWAGELYDHLKNGGPDPNWDAYPNAAKYYECWMVTNEG